MGVGWLAGWVLWQCCTLGKFVGLLPVIWWPAAFLACTAFPSHYHHNCHPSHRSAHCQEYNQVVLVGDAFDSRPFRLPWPEGTVLFCVAPAAAHAVADAAYKAAGARVPRGCLLRRVPAELADGASFAGALEKAGFRGDRLSVWAIQVGGESSWHCWN